MSETLLKGRKINNENENAIFVIQLRIFFTALYIHLAVTLLPCYVVAPQDKDVIWLYSTFDVLNVTINGVCMNMTLLV